MAGSTTLLDFAGSTPPAASGQKTMAFGSDRRSNGSGRGGGKRPMPHIDDIVSVTVDIDVDLAHAPIDRVLQTAETYLRQAESAKTFGRPDLALKDYIRTNIVLLDIIKKNKGWVSLRDSQSQKERYQRLLQQVDASHSYFEKIKADIKADNARTGVQPTVHRPAASVEGSSTPDGQQLGQRGINGTSTVATLEHNGVPNGPSPHSHKERPAVHPKPANLHGNALKPASGAGVPSSKVAQDLVQRFANLRANPNSAGQDPRIQTQPILPPQPATSQDAPESQRTSLSFSDTLAEMPRVPDAIYNPVRGTISSEAAQLPSSASRAMFTRTNSTASLPTNTKNANPPESDEYFVPAQTFGNSSSPAKRAKPTVPAGFTISAEDLVRYMKTGAKDISILIIDIRSREKFDEGHIMSQATICLESQVLSRPHISANEIADSMVLAPTSEQLLFERRHEFDLIVFYDDFSDRLILTPTKPGEKAVAGLYNALSHFDFSAGSRPKPPVKLLEGGLYAWTNVVGKGGLQTSSTASMISFSTTPMARAMMSRPSKYVIRPIQDPAEAKRWEAAISNFTAIRTTDDFLRRYPAVPMHESMASPATAPEIQSAGNLSNNISYGDTLHNNKLPPVPTRPPPALSKRSYIGLADDESELNPTASRLTVKLGKDHVRKYRTGLKNTGVSCFANSSLQALFATPGFSRELWTEEFKDRYQVPMKKIETYPNPQLLTKMLAKLVQLLNQGESAALLPSTLMEYVRSIHAKDASGKQKREDLIFGGSAQQDAQEFFSFLMDNIHDETNIYRDRTPRVPKQYTSQDGTITQNAIDWWQDYSRANASIVSKYFHGLEVYSSRCLNPRCRQETRTFNQLVLLPLQLDNITDPTDLRLLIANYQKTEVVDDVSCDACHQKGQRQRTPKFARLPDRLSICLKRFGFDRDRGEANKIHTQVRFPFRDLDMSPYCAEPDPNMAQTKDQHFAGPMIYDCYAVIVHGGNRISGGHYWTFVQDDQSKDPTDWFKCNDTQVTRVKIGGRESNPEMVQEMYGQGTTSAYILLYKRRGT
ncbi:hypothetical protein B0T22DRAFT_284516 [Podospora appendiculata]|uniref:Ubiquitin carboxyl-terminal hydrolase n=1 Tax=Podospora appendiculata TaxID=314037 RepID=A0AAE1C859_9PEZI|nr:hypothetical protein B0T22DRAFT_284516 [Podospora appendiculata]